VCGPCEPALLQVLVENPGTGLLKERDVIQAYPHSVQLDYCQVGRGGARGSGGEQAIWTTRAEAYLLVHTIQK
jgi:hypothetical protein